MAVTTPRGQHDRQRVQELQARPGAQDDERHGEEHQRERSRQDRRRRSRRAAGLLEVPHHGQLGPGREPKGREQPEQGAEREVTRRRRVTPISPPDRLTGSATASISASRQLPKAAWNTRKAASAAAIPNPITPGLADLAGGGLPDHLGVVLDREVQGGELLLDVGGDRLRASAVDAGHYVEPPGDGVTADDCGRLCNPHVGDLAERDRVTASGGR